MTILTGLLQMPLTLSMVNRNTGKGALLRPLWNKLRGKLHKIRKFCATKAFNTAMESWKSQLFIAVLIASEAWFAPILCPFCRQTSVWVFLTFRNSTAKRWIFNFGPSLMSSKNPREYLLGDTVICILDVFFNLLYAVQYFKKLPPTRYLYNVLGR